jgi:hypothetical protein
MSLNLYNIPLNPTQPWSIWTYFSAQNEAQGADGASAHTHINIWQVQAVR